MAYVTPEQALNNLHEYFDDLKKRSIDWVKAGNEILTHEEPEGIHQLAKIKFYKKPLPTSRKHYSFHAAFQIMNEKHEWMMPIGYLHAYRKYAGGSWLKKTDCETIALGENHAFTPEERDATWVEVQSL